MMSLASYGQGGEACIIVCDECRSVVTTMGAMTREDFETRLVENTFLPLLGHAILVRAHAATSGWRADGGDAWLCERCSTDPRPLVPEATGEPDLE
jgi:hypothetical protein